MCLGGPSLRYAGGRSVCGWGYEGPNQPATGRKTVDISLWFWVGFNVFVLAMLALDLGVFHRQAHEVRFREAATWSAVWVTVALAFNALIYWQWGSEAALQFLTGYLIEKSLSV